MLTHFDTFRYLYMSKIPGMDGMNGMGGVGWKELDEMDGLGGKACKGWMGCILQAKVVCWSFVVCCTLQTPPSTLLSSVLVRGPGGPESSVLGGYIYGYIHG